MTGYVKDGRITIASVFLFYAVGNCFAGLYICCMFHRFDCDISGIDLPDKFTYPFCYEPHSLVVLAARQVQGYLSVRGDWSDEIGKGKMFGVLVAADGYGNVGFLAAYSGNIAHCNNHPYFVPPVYDLLQPDGFFRREEKKISLINDRISSLEASVEFVDLKGKLALLKKEADENISAFREKMKLSKARRDSLRSRGIDTPEMIRESQFEKAELRRIKRRYCSEIEAIEKNIKDIELEISELKARRKERSAELQRRLFEHFYVYNANGDKAGLLEIFERARHELPPAGAGECAAPKLLQYAYIHSFKPLAIGEFWWGKSPESAVRKHLHFYPACKSKCEPILNFMLQGLDVADNPLSAISHGEVLSTVYEDEYLWVVDKPEGMLSVPGKVGGLSVFDLACERFPDAHVFVVHRLDMHTSGLLIVAKSKDVYKELQRQFTEREVKKEYIAIVRGRVVADEGRISLPLSPDYCHRPMQKVDYGHGKCAVTDYCVLQRYANGLVRVKFVPLTGRTHQLRVHSSHSLGLDAPIKGDMLYGEKSGRLYLHASRIVFRHPVTGKEIDLSSVPPF